VGPADLGTRQGGSVTAATGGQPDLSAFQQEVARMFFALPASKGFLLAGGAALLASTSRRGPPRISTSSPLPSREVFPPHAMR